MGISHVLRLCLQGGGVFIDGGTVTFLSCTVTGNTAYNVLTLKLPIAPMGKLLTCLLRLTLCTTGNASVNYRMYVKQRP